MSEDKDSKTEAPTQKKLDDAKKKGQSYSSREINSFMLLFTMAMLISWSADDIFASAQQGMAHFITQPDMIQVNGSELGTMLTETVITSARLLAMPMLAFVIAALVAGLAQKPLAVSLESIRPKFEKISPAKGWKKIASAKSLTEFGKGIFKITLVGIACTLAIWPRMDDIQRLPNTEFDGLLFFIKELTMSMMTAVVIIMFFVALLDYLYQRFDFMKNLRMSKHEIKEEYKQQEGDPHIKGKLKQMRMERSRRRMMAEVPTSDVVITNPTHYAVALRYDNTRMSAPMIVAKGQDKVAFKIREIAEENDIPIVENPPLARALFPAPVDSEVPLEHYKAVAEVISYVYKLKNKTLRPR